MKDLHFTGILGSGGFCVVKSANYEGRAVAVKIPHAKFSQNELLKAVREEAGIFRQLSHRNILTMYGVIAGNEPGLVLELCKVCECYPNRHGGDLMQQDIPLKDGMCLKCGGVILSRLTLKIADLGLCKKLQYRHVDCRYF
ncbi:unnamed protein product [Enterobius vermicularis]|uniref:Protein kinase domain-containing protein n=1 Tax=Enterobius vermicularis TaxID=51028 RepID=A0A0N4VHN8_ENTVE|nr:unnamed protein product [Enterobius vermicularis]